MSYCLSGPFRMWKPVAQMQNATRLEWDIVHTHAVNDLNGVRILPEMHMLRDATSTKRPRIPGNSGEIQGFPVFPALPLIDLQGSASKIHWHYRHYGHYFLKTDPRENVSFKATTHKVWFMQIKQGLRLEKLWSNDVKHTVYLNLLKCDAIYPHSSSLPQVFTATVCACGCCGCYISAGRWSARDPTDATNPITLGEVGDERLGKRVHVGQQWVMTHYEPLHN